MSYLGAFHRFRCDWCQAICDADSLPKAWRWVKAGLGFPVRHACEKCIDLVEDKAAIRRPGEKN